MNSLVVYLGSDHVIQEPGFDFRKNSLRLAANAESAIEQACRRNAAGILNSYRLDLDALNVRGLRQEAISGFEDFDVVFASDAEGEFVSLRSRSALDSLMFLSASFVSQ